jgi:2-keto-4-pentenoate hydratase/2-oxohepta-3-ene-1,7-dioic acid hydratase in catechol pathway
VQAALNPNVAPPVFIKQEDVQYGPVVRRPEKIVSAGHNYRNYRRHAKEVNMAIPKQPVLFSKFNHVLSPPNGAIKLPFEVAKKFDYETGLVIVIGKTAKTSASPPTSLIQTSSRSSAGSTAKLVNRPAPMISSSVLGKS